MKNDFHITFSNIEAQDSAALHTGYRSFTCEQ
jgi:hypothetical protein